MFKMKIDGLRLPHRLTFLGSRADKARHDRAMRILARPNPDWRAVKKAHRLLRDADRAGRIARKEEMERAWASLKPGFHGLADAFKRANESIAAATSSLSGFRIPILPPGDEIRTVAVKPARRMGKTAAKIEARKLREVNYSTRAAVDATNHYEIGDIDDLLDNPAVKRLRDLADNRARAMHDRMLAAALTGKVAQARGSCRHGVWLYGDSCATCAREDAKPPSSSRHEDGDEQE